MKHNADLQFDRQKSEILLALSKSQLFIQNLADLADSIVPNEDSFNEMGEVLDRIIQAEKAVISAYDIGKEPSYTEYCRWCDAKNDLLGHIKAIKTPLQLKYTAIGTEIHNKKQRAIEDARRIQDIKDGIEANILAFSSRIAACLTKKELDAVERDMNLEKTQSRSAKYGELHEYAISRYDTALIPTLREQKKVISERELLDKSIESSNNPFEIDELSKKRDQVENQIRQNQVKVQEMALHQEHDVIIAEEIFPDVDVRNNFEIEVVDLGKAIRKRMDLFEIKLSKVRAKAVLNMLRDSGSFNDKSEIVVDGIRYFKKIKIMP